MKYTYFTPGPSELYFTVEYHLKQALKSGIPSISHRSKEFEAIYSSVKEKLPILIDLPDDYRVLFTSSATEVWERIGQNLVSNESFHFTNGAFANKFIQSIESIGKKAIIHRVKDGESFDLDSVMIPETAELISITQNETSTGTRFPIEDIHTLRTAFPGKLIAVDAVSSIPCEPLDFSKIDCLYFSVQKCFGLPSGLGVWLINDKCIEKATEMKEKGHFPGSYHSIPSLVKMYDKNQTPETPNVLGIYLLSRVIEDMLMKGIDQIRREINYKAALMYQSISDHPKLHPFVNEERIRSKTVIVFKSDQTEVIHNHFKSKRFIVGKGYGKYQDRHIRIANFPTHSKESFEKVADLITSIP